MDVLGILRLIRLIMYSLKGSKNEYNTLIDLRKKLINCHQGNKTCNEYLVPFWTVVEVLDSCGEESPMTPDPLIV